MVPKPGEPGSETWPADGEAWARGGGNCWLTGTFDPETNLLYVGTGNPAPDFDGEVREGDNLYTDSIVAVDADAGPDPLALPVHPARRVGLRQHRRVHPVRVGRAQAARALRQERLLLRARPHRRVAGPDHPLRRPDRLGEHHPGRQGHPLACTPRKKGNRSTSTRARRAPRNGRTRPTARAPSCSTCRCRTSGPRPRDGAASSRRASPTGARACRSTSRTCRGPSARSTPTARRSGAGATSSRCARRCSPPRATWCSPVSRPASSTRSTPAPASCSGSSSAAAATTAARPPTSVDGRQYIAVPVGWGGWAEGFLPGMLGAGHGSALIVFALPEQ